MYKQKIKLIMIQKQNFINKEDEKTKDVRNV